MAQTTQIGREALLELRPSAYLRGRGCLDEAGEPRGDLGGNFTSAASSTFEEAELAPQELLTFYEAIKQCLKIGDAKNASERFRQALDEAFDITADLLGKDINPAIIDWVREWVPFIHSAKCVIAFMRHMNAVVQQYTLTMRIKHGA
jgi:hypothetical protein